MAGDVNNKDHRDLIVPLLGDLRAYSRFLVAHETEADRLVEETVVRALEGLQQLSDTSNLRTRLFGLLRNAFYRNIRQRRGARRVPGALRRMAADRNSKDLVDFYRCLFGLPVSLREALVLVGPQGMSFEEAAGVCGVPVSTIRSRVDRARARMAGGMERNSVAPCGRTTGGSMQAIDGFRIA